MKLKEFFEANRKFKFPEVPEVTTQTVGDFFNETAGKVIAPAKSIIAIHKMLVAYAKDALKHNEPARFLSRLHESVAMGHGVTETRRGGWTETADGLNYAFASNYFARVIYMLAYLGWKPDLSDFKDMIVNRRVFIGFPLRGPTAGERHISAYPVKAKAEYRTDALYAPGWYLAHIVGVMDPFAGHEDIDLRGDVLPRGEFSDWNDENGVPIRRIPRSLSKREKEVVVAQFLRFLDPINYVLVPNEKRERHSPQTRTRIGEEPSLISYLKGWMREYVGSEVYDEFCKLALVSIEDPYDGNDARALGGLHLKVITARLPMAKNSDSSCSKNMAIKKLVSAQQETKKSEKDIVSTPKAIRRIKLWSQRPNGHPYRVIRAFLLSQYGEVASYQQMQEYCTDFVDHPEMYIDCFTERGTWGSMKSDGGNNYGHVFECEPGSDEVRIWQPVKDELDKYREAFLA